jgi:hypothetical protein
VWQCPTNVIIPKQIDVYVTSASRETAKAPDPAGVVAGIGGRPQSLQSQMQARWSVRPGAYPQPGALLPDPEDEVDHGGEHVRRERESEEARERDRRHLASMCRVSLPKLACRTGPTRPVCISQHSHRNSRSTIDPKTSQGIVN